MSLNHITRVNSSHPAGGGAYYFAKQSINADRQARFEAELKRKAQLKAMENDHKRQAAINAPTLDPNDDASLKRANMTRFQNAADDVASPSAEASHGRTIRASRPAHSRPLLTLACCAALLLSLALCFAVRNP